MSTLDNADINTLPPPAVRATTSTLPASPEAPQFPPSGSGPQEGETTGDKGVQFSARTEDSSTEVTYQGGGLKHISEECSSHGTKDQVSQPDQSINTTLEQIIPVHRGPEYVSPPTYLLKLYLHPPSLLSLALFFSYKKA